MAGNYPVIDNFPKRTGQRLTRHIIATFLQHCLSLLSRYSSNFVLHFRFETSRQRGQERHSVKQVPNLIVYCTSSEPPIHSCFPTLPGILRIWSLHLRFAFWTCIWDLHLRFVFEICFWDLYLRFAFEIWTVLTDGTKKITHVNLHKLTTRIHQLYFLLASTKRKLSGM